MSIQVISGDDTLVLYGRVFTDFADGDISQIVFNEDIATMKTGKNRNTAYSRNESGNNAEATIKLMRGSSDDQFLLNFLSQYTGDFAATVLAAGQFVKRLGDGAGNITNDVYNLNGGIFSRQVDAKENTSGDTEQSVAIYRMKFAYGARAIQ